MTDLIPPSGQPRTPARAPVFAPADEATRIRPGRVRPAVAPPPGPPVGPPLGQPLGAPAGAPLGPPPAYRPGSSPSPVRGPAPVQPRRRRRVLRRVVLVGVVLVLAAAGATLAALRPWQSPASADPPASRVGHGELHLDWDRDGVGEVVAWRFVDDVDHLTLSSDEPDFPGEQTFRVAASLADGRLRVAVADHDGDGRVDIVVTVPGDGAVRVLRGDGAGGFAAVTPGG